MNTPQKLVHAAPSLSPGRHAAMRLFLTSAAILLLGNTGCIIPLPNKISQGHRHSADALAFLDLPGTTRDEVIATLGAPLIESKDRRTVLYKWEETPRFLASVPRIVHSDVELRGEVITDYPVWFGLFIAYDEQGDIEAHEVREISVLSLEQACMRWRARHERKR